MVEIKLSYEIKRKRLAEIIEEAMKKSLKPRGYEVRTQSYTERYYPAESTKLTTVETHRIIEASRELEESDNERWGDANIVTANGKLIGGYHVLEFDYPKLDVRGECSSFYFHVIETRITANSESSWVVEPYQPAYKRYSPDVNALVKEFNRRITKEKKASEKFISNKRLNN